MTKRDDLLKRQAELSPAKRSLLDRWKGGEATPPTAQPIPRRVEQGPAPLSFAQQGLWFLDQVTPGMVAYNMPVAARLTGPLDVNILHRSLNAVAKRQAALRTTFTTVDERPVQVIAPAGDVILPLPLVDLRRYPAPSREQETRRLVEEEILRPFDLARGPLLRARLLRLSEQEHVLVLTTHHIISDTWSREVLIRELMACYTAFATGKPPALPELPIQYADYATWQREQLGAILETQLAYWKGQLAGAPPVLQLPVDRPRPAVQTFCGARHSLSLPGDLARALAAFSQGEEATMFMTMLAAFELLLSRYSGSDDIVIGTDIANRTRPGTEALIGFFVNTLVLRADLSGDPTFRELLGRVRKMTLAAYAHQDMPFERLVEELQPERSLSHLPLFQVMFSFQAERELDAAPGQRGGLATTLEGLGLTLEPLTSEGGTAKFDLELVLLEGPGRLAGYFEYNTDLFEAATIARLADHFLILLAGIAATPDSRVSALPLLAEAERRRLLLEWNETTRHYPDRQCFHQLFEEQAERTPNAVAVVDHRPPTADHRGWRMEDGGWRMEDGPSPTDDRRPTATDNALDITHHVSRFTFHESVTYAELNACANRLARLLVARGAGPEVVVALLADRGPDFLAAMLAIFKAGAAYLPLDPYHPPRRLRQVLEESRAPLVLASESFAPALAQALEELPPDARPALLGLEELLRQPHEEANLPPRAAPGNLAYAIYTSGSTGVPKGALVEQRGMLNHLYAKIHDLGLTAGDTVVQNASQCFDISVWQFLAPLLVGGRVRIVADEIAHDPARLLDLVAAEQDSILEVVPSLLQAMLEQVARRGDARPDLAALRWLIPTGEALPPDLARRWLRGYPGIPLLNAYGPTECSDDVTHHPISALPAADVARVPIGRPVANMRLYILDRRMEPVPLGVTGELYVGGVGVGRGYLNRPDLTAERFVPNPFSNSQQSAVSSQQSAVSSQQSAGNDRTTGDWRLATGDWRLATGDWRLATGDWRLATATRLYRTGDLCRYRDDGAIEFLGRIDTQVKLRGYRIELGEIEAALRQNPAVREAVVVAHLDRGETRLVAYIVTSPLSVVSCQLQLTTDNGQLTKDLRQFLLDRLPDYMVPSTFVLLDALPFTPNGKIDRKALPAPDLDRPAGERAYVAPRTPVAEVVAGVWGDILRLERVGADDNFFELGGHSLRAAQAVARLQDVFPVRLTLRMLFEMPTVERLAQAIEQAGREAQVDVIRIAHVFLSLDQMSDEEVERMLADIE